ncbi:MAG: PHP domain-containing protein, partial [Romboutsia sp.]|nr:PHP domain-containing protein [Romboutsia sp.]
METVKDYLDKLEIKNSILAKQLKETYINRVVYFKEDRVVYFYLTSKSIISNEVLDMFVEELKFKLDYFKNIKVKIRYTGLDRKENKDIIKIYWMNILYILKQLCPSIAGWYKQVEYLCIDDMMKIKIPKGIFYDRLIKQNVVYVLKNILNEELGIDLDIIIEKAIDEEVNIEKIIRKTENITNEKVKELEIKSNEEEKEDEEAAYVIKPEVDENLVYGENVNAMLEKINTLGVNSGTVCIMGEVFDIETKELRNGKILLIASVTDYTSSISCKLFLTDTNKDYVLNHVKKGAYLKIKGDIIYDTYQRELTLTISGIRKEKKVEREDTVEGLKRVELHAHTQMSSMDAVCPTKKLVERAAKWGHKAVAITDHGVVQAFPDAMSAAKSNDIKVLYGVEGYLVEDNSFIIEDANDKELSQTFVVFDIETTGFSNTNDKITEIGAVKIENFEVVDRFSQLINPQKDISYKIQELTGITNDMVRNEPTIEEVLPKFIEFVGDSVLVAHNADFDMSFIKEKCRQQNIEFKNTS